MALDNKQTATGQADSWGKETNEGGEGKRARKTKGAEEKKKKERKSVQKGQLAIQTDVVREAGHQARIINIFPH